MNKIMTCMLLLLALILMAGCGTKGVAVKANYPVAKDGYAVYGNFCGPGYPDSGKSDPAEDLVYLAQIEPKDLIDKACKIHDMCYSLYPNNHKECDIFFVRNMDSIKGNMYLDRCNRIHSAVNRAIAAKINPEISLIYIPDLITDGVSVYMYILTQPGTEHMICGELSMFNPKMIGEELISKYRIKKTPAR